MSSALLRSLKFVRAYRWYALAGVLAILATTVADLVGPQILRVIIDQGITKSDFHVILVGSLSLIAVALFDGLANFLSGYFTAQASHGSAYQMRNTIFDKLQRLSFTYHDQAQTGQLITRVTSDVDQVRDFVGSGLVQVIAAVLMLVGSVILLLRMNVWLALLSFTVVPATAAVLAIFVRQLGPMFRGRQQKLAALNTVLQENIAGARVVRAFAREKHEIERYGQANGALLDQGLQVQRTVSNAFPLMFSIGTIGVGFVTWAGAVQIVRGTLTVGELVAFSSYIFLLLGPLTTLGFSAQQIAQSSASAERLFEVLDAPEDVAEKPHAHPLPRLTGRVEWRDVHLRYPGSTTETLRGVSFATDPDTTVAVVGATGSGKTSLVNLIPRFYDATSGALLVDGYDVRDVTLESLRGQIGVVMQDSVLFSGTVRDNIAYGRPDATDQDVHDAARAAQADAFIGELPEGYATRVGERGVKLSGGQRQRIAIARALLIDPRILIMDDSTSAVDSATEAAIREQLTRLMRGRTSFVIAQRLATARRADVVLVMDDGQLVDSGTHEQLLERSCLYAEIAASQLIGGEELAGTAACAADLEPGPAGDGAEPGGVI